MSVECRYKLNVGQHILCVVGMIKWGSKSETLNSNVCVNYSRRLRIVPILHLLSLTLGQIHVRTVKLVAIH